MILANDDRPRTMHAEAERTERHLLPDVVSDLLQYHEQRGAARRAVWCEHTATARAQRAAAYERMAGAADRGAERTLDLDADGLELWHSRKCPASRRIGEDSVDVVVWRRY